MARLWRDQKKRDKACNILAPPYSWFTEGFDTPDLKEAKIRYRYVASRSMSSLARVGGKEGD
jgi:hypothetical protein